MFMDSFDLFPICAIVNGKFIALHGGLSPLLTTVNKTNNFVNFSSLTISISLTDFKNHLDQDCSVIFSGQILLIMTKVSKKMLIKRMK